jgi:hypothetical protein
VAKARAADSSRPTVLDKAMESLARSR